jgi:hypothetical protein
VTTSTVGLEQMNSSCCGPSNGFDSNWLESLDVGQDGDAM